MVMSATTTASDQQLWLQVRESDNVKAMELLFKKNYPALCAFAHRIVSSEAAAQDIVQNTMVQLWEKRKQTEIQSSVKAYLFKSVHNAALNTLKRETRLQYLQEDGDNDAIFGLQQPVHDSFSSVHQRVRAAIDKLPEKCRMVFLLSREKNLKYQEIAEALDISIKTVENHMNKALKILHLHLGDLLFWFAIVNIGGSTYA